MAKAEPSIDAKTEQLVCKGRWSVPGYKVCFSVSSPHGSSSSSSISVAYQPSFAKVAHIFQCTPLYDVGLFC